MSSGSASSEDEYSWKCSPSLWFIMDEGTLYGCQNAVLSTTHSPAVLQRGGSQSIIDHLFFCICAILLKIREQREELTWVSLAIGVPNFTIPPRSFIFLRCASRSFSSSFLKWREGLFWFLVKKIQRFWRSACPQDSVYMVDHQGSMLASRIKKTCQTYTFIDQSHSFGLRMN